MLQDKSIHPHQISFESSIARIEVDLYAANLWITHNDKEDSIYFSKISLENEPVRKKVDLNFQEKDFVLNTVCNDFLVLSKVTDPGRPDEQSIYIFDTRKNEIIDSYKGWRFKGFITDSIIYLEKPGFENMKRKKVDLGKYRDQEKEKSINLYQPALYLPKNELYGEIRNFLNNDLSLSIVSPIEMLEYNHNIYLCVHNEEKGTLSKNLYCINDKREVVYQEILYKKLQKRVPDSFFVSCNFLIFVSNFNVLNLLNLNSQNAS